jgi:hypothetical protein
MYPLAPMRTMEDQMFSWPIVARPEVERAFIFTPLHLDDWRERIYEWGLDNECWIMVRYTHLHVPLTCVEVQSNKLILFRLRWGVVDPKEYNL